MALRDPMGRSVSIQLPPRRSTFPLQGGREIIPTPAASRVGRVLSPQHRALESMIRSRAHYRAPIPQSARNRATAGPRALQSSIQGLLGGLRSPGPSPQSPTPVPAPPQNVMTTNGMTSQPLVYQPNPMGAPVPSGAPGAPMGPQFQMLPYYAQPTGIAAPYQIQAQQGLASAGPVRGMTVF